MNRAIRSILTRKGWKRVYSKSMRGCRRMKQGTGLGQSGWMTKLGVSSFLVGAKRDSKPYPCWKVSHVQNYKEMPVRSIYSSCLLAQLYIIYSLYQLVCSLSYLQESKSYYYLNNSFFASLGLLSIPGSRAPTQSLAQDLFFSCMLIQLDRTPHSTTQRIKNIRSNKGDRDPKKDYPNRSLMQYCCFRPTVSTF